MAMNDNTLRVKEFMSSRGVEVEIVTFDESTRTSELAAAAIGCEVAQIAKSLVFIADDKQPILVIASGPNRVDTEKLAKHVGKREMQIADAKTVKQVTGFPVGGVPPVAHHSQLRTILDPSLMRFEVVYAGGRNAQHCLRNQPERIERVNQR